MTTYFKFASMEEETLECIRDVAESFDIMLSESYGEGDDLYYPFEEGYKAKATPGLLKYLKQPDIVNILNSGIKVVTMKSLGEFFMNALITGDVYY
jgi:hypothetical protein